MSAGEEKAKATRAALNGKMLWNKITHISQVLSNPYPSYSAAPQTEGVWPPS